MGTLGGWASPQGLLFAPTTLPCPQCAGENTGGLYVYLWMRG